MSYGSNIEEDNNNIVYKTTTMRLKEAVLHSTFKIDLASRTGKGVWTQAKLMQIQDGNYTINTIEGKRHMCDGYEKIIDVVQPK